MSWSLAGLVGLTLFPSGLVLFCFVLFLFSFLLLTSEFIALICSSTYIHIYI